MKKTDCEVFRIRVREKFTPVAAHRLVGWVDFLSGEQSRRNNEEGVKTARAQLAEAFVREWRLEAVRRQQEQECEKVAALVATLPFGQRRNAFARESAEFFGAVYRDALTAAQLTALRQFAERIQQQA